MTAPAGELHKRATVAAVSVAVTSQPRSAKTSCIAAALRDLWVGHIFWVRNVSIAIFNTNDVAMNAAERQAVSNAKSIAATIEPFYGVAAKEAFFKLLAGHYGAVKAYLVATASGDASAQANATQSLTSNAEEIAVFLSKANPYLQKDALHSLLLAHGGHHIQQIQELKDRKYDAEAKTWKTSRINLSDSGRDSRRTGKTVYQRVLMRCLRRGNGRELMVCFTAHSEGPGK